MELDSARERIKYYLRSGNEKVEEEAAVMERIRDIFIVADETLLRHGKFNYHWRTITSLLCSLNIQFPTLQRAFQIRYGAITHEEGEKPSYINSSTHSNDRKNNSHIQWTIMEEDSIKNNPDLDHDAMKEILRRLPVPSLMRAKTVCKAWNMAISATHFNVINQTDDFVTQQSYHGIAFFCAALNQWFPIDLPWNQNTWDRNKHYHSHPTKLHLCAAADGLFLFLDPNYQPVIFNVLTKEHGFLPPPKRWMDRTAVELIVHGGHIEIITIERFEEVVHLFNSSTDKWKDIPTPFPLFGSNTHDWKSTLHNGMAYFTNNFGLHLGCYDIVCREFQFKEIKGGLPPHIDYRESKNNYKSNLPSLLACNGKLILVGRLEEAGSKLWGGFPFIEHNLVGIWLLDLREESYESWSLISITPRDLLEDTVRSSHGTDFIVASSLDTIWLTIKGSKNLLTYNLRYMEWNVLPGYTAEDLVDCAIQRRGICAPFKISPSFNLSPNPPKPIQ